MAHAYGTCIWHMHMAHVYGTCTWHMAHGTWHMAHGTWHMAHGTLYIAHCIWCLCRSLSTRGSVLAIVPKAVLGWLAVNHASGSITPSGGYKRRAAISSSAIVCSGSTSAAMSKLARPSIPQGVAHGDVFTYARSPTPKALSPPPPRPKLRVPKPQPSLVSLALQP